MMMSMFKIISIFKHEKIAKRERKQDIESSKGKKVYKSYPFSVDPYLIAYAIEEQAKEAKATENDKQTQPQP